MLKGLRVLLAGILVSFAMAGCGPEKPSIDRTKEELVHRNEKEVATLPAVTGFYVGKWIASSGTVYKAALSLYLTKQRRKLPLEGEEIEVTVLGGSIYLYDEDPKLELQGLGAVLSGNYDPNTGRLVLSLGPVPGAPGTEDREFSGIFNGKDIQGTLPIKGRATELKVHMVEKL